VSTQQQGIDEGGGRSVTRRSSRAGKPGVSLRSSSRRSEPCSAAHELTIVRSKGVWALRQGVWALRQGARAPRQSAWAPRHLPWKLKKKCDRTAEPSTGPAAMEPLSDFSCSITPEHRAFEFNPMAAPVVLASPPEATVHQGSTRRTGQSIWDNSDCGAPGEAPELSFCPVSSTPQVWKPPALRRLLLCCPPPLLRH
jgi:hypothetical protein